LVGKVHVRVLHSGNRPLMRQSSKSSSAERLQCVTVAGRHILATGMSGPCQSNKSAGLCRWSHRSRRAPTNLLPCCRNKEEAMSTIDRNLTPRWSRLKTRFAAWRRLTRTRRSSRTEAEIQAYTRPWI
jgi:hypothetical protein